ncbi:MAG: response regulator transcription factor [Spirochaetes bacterium]|nr:response regulator transcription factor [Spirochaetota bacterium]MBU1081771.1 response regulator transcription factor [Spirochaetota bacterium]
MLRIAVVEDDRKIRDAMIAALARWGHEAVAVEDWERVAEAVVALEPKLVVLDVNLPAYDGFHWCRRIRELSEVPVLVVSSRSDTMDLVMALGLGADDYVPKPFSLDAFVAKVHALLRRAYDYRGSEADLLERGGVVLDLRSNVVSSGSGKVDLTRNEFLLLRTLLRRAGEVVSRDELQTALWRDEVFVEDNTLTVNMNRLRKKLTDIGRPEAVRTVKGMGYAVD